MRGQVQFIDVDFAYTGTAPLLRAFTTHIEPGEFVAIVGPSGAGKSTLAHLLMCFYDPARGCIRVHGVDIRTSTQESLRSHIAVVWQEPCLADDTVRGKATTRIVC